MLLSELTNQTKDAEVEIAGETISVTFYTHYSPAMRSEALKEGRISKEEYDTLSDPKADNNVTMPASLAVRLKSWTLEVVNGHGPEKPPVTSEFLSRFKDEHFVSLYKTVFGVSGENPSDADDSPNG